MSDLLEKVRDAITEEAASSEQQAELVALEKELEKLSDPLARFFPRSRRIDR
jgi:hypothetical protein